MKFIRNNISIIVQNLLRVDVVKVFAYVPNSGVLYNGCDGCGCGGCDCEDDDK